MPELPGADMPRELQRTISRLMKTQADLFERTVKMLREPSRRIEAVVGREPGRSGRKPSRRRGV